MLHFITGSTISPLAFEVIEANDTVVILEGFLTSQLKTWLESTKKDFHILSESMDSSDPHTINFDQFVSLCENISPIQSWY